MTAESRNAVTIVLDGIDARVMSETAFDQHLQRPEGSAGNGIAGRAVYTGRHAASILDCPDGLLRVPLEFGRRQIVDQAVGEAVAPDLMSGGGDAANQAGMVFGYPAEHKE